MSWPGRLSEVADDLLTARALNRAVLARQLLLDRSSLPVPQAVEAVAGLQTQYAPSGYIALWSRLAGFRRADLTEALHAGAVVQSWAMRCTIHMTSAADHPVLCAAVREARRAWWRRTVIGRQEVTEDDLVAAAGAVRGYLAAGPLKQAEIQRRLAEDGFGKAVWPGVQLWVELVRVPPAGTWEQPRAHLYGLAPDPDPEPDVAAARAHLVRRYLRGFGPASTKDVASFCGWTVTEARAVLAGMELRRFRDESGGELLDVPDAPLPDPEMPAPVRFIGQWEAILLAHARRAQVLPEQHRGKVFSTTMPRSVPTFLVDGQVAGTWRFDEERAAVGWEPFAPLPASAVVEVAAEAERLTEFHRAG
ncbi:Winged helix DNA-binding domain-containing protein [Pseudonocardia thermophila]|uniref:Winged helix DNA-binding domain-containing protein n=1 Tax=Pseudonocardia thermophila TaxID=1848 RepID=A0A1M6VZA4_PSETH|nr:Winged helix DNA-binding domain-containing protein [Pseudonocardia thermophila]